MYISLIGYEGRYEISNLGDIRKVSTKRSIKLHTDKDGYLVCYPFNGSKTTTLGIHRALALTFIANPSGKPTVNHIDGDKTNNSLSNLEWATRKEQSVHSTTILGKNIAELQGNYVPTNDVLILELLSLGKSQLAIAKELNISQSTVSRIKNDNRFKNTKGAAE